MFAISLQFLSVIELDLFALVPFGCLFEVSYHTSLITQTAMPLVLCSTLAAATAMLKVRGERQKRGLAKKKRAIMRRSQVRLSCPLADANVLANADKPLALSLSETLSI